MGHPDLRNDYAFWRVFGYGSDCMRFLSAASTFALLVAAVSFEAFAQQVAAPPSDPPHGTDPRGDSSQPPDDQGVAVPVNPSGSKLEVAEDPEPVRKRNRRRPPPPPPPPPPPVVKPDKMSMTRGDWPTLRFGFGFAVDPVNEDQGAPFNFDVHAGWRLSLSRWAAAWPQAGYSYDAGKRMGGHFATAGLGLVFGNLLAHVGLRSHFIGGSAPGGTGLGVENAFVAAFLADLLSVDVAHRHLRIVGIGHDEARILFSVDFIPLLAIGVVLGKR